MSDIIHMLQDMARPFFSFLPNRSHLLWLAWLRAVETLRPACARHTTFLWLTVVLAALCLRPDLGGVTSLVRALGLSPASYYCLLHFFHSDALNLGKLTLCWRAALERLLARRLVRVKGRPILLVDGLKRGKEGRKMPAVKGVLAADVRKWDMDGGLGLRRDIVTSSKPLSPQAERADGSARAAG